ncbi:hypothetical protein A2U01_0067626, partial [Trifolium medium]|nr:hypothetical protein [Trifolium medium]
ISACRSFQLPYCVRADNAATCAVRAVMAAVKAALFVTG